MRLFIVLTGLLLTASPSAWAEERREKIDALNKSNSEVERLGNEMNQALKRRAEALNAVQEMIGKNPSGWVLRTGDATETRTEIPMTKELAATLKALTPVTTEITWWPTTGNPTFGEPCIASELCYCTKPHGGGGAMICFPQ